MSESAMGFRRLAGPIALAFGLVLAGCTVQPLYGPQLDGTTLRVDLSAISILPAETRIDQIVRNELLFAFTGGGPAGAPLYELSLSASPGGGSFDVTAPGNEPSSGASVTVRFSLVEIGTGQIIAQGSRRAETRYTRSNSEFANVRASEDAQQRAAVAAADLVRIAIESAMAARP